MSIAAEFEEEIVTMTADEALAQESQKADGRKSEGAETAARVISEMLKDGCRSAKEMEDKLAELGISERSMRTARKNLGVLTRKKAEGWEWYFPGQDEMEI